jgi:hypothetical protein
VRPDRSCPRRLSRRDCRATVAPALAAPFAVLQRAALPVRADSAHSARIRTQMPEVPLQKIVQGFLGAIPFRQRLGAHVRCVIIPAATGLHAQPRSPVNSIAAMSTFSILSTCALRSFVLRIRYPSAIIGEGVGGRLWRIAVQGVYHGMYSHARLSWPATEHCSPKTENGSYTRSALMAGPGYNRPTCSALVCLLPPGADMVREKAPMLGRTFQLDTSAGCGKRACMRFRAPPVALPVAGLGLSTTFLRAPCLGPQRQLTTALRRGGGSATGDPARKFRSVDQQLGCGYRVSFRMRLGPTSNLNPTSSPLKFSQSASPSLQATN